MIDLRLSQLRSFLAVADVGHFGRAAAELGLGQPAVSQHIRRLEDELGFELFARSSRSVALTPAGGHFRELAHGALSELDRGAAQARAISAGELGTLRVAAQQAARCIVLPEIVIRLTREAPQLRLEVVPATTAQAIRLLLDGAVDVALMRDPTPPAGIASEVLALDPMTIVLPIGHPLAGRETIGVAELADEPRIGWARDGAPELHDRLTALLAAAGVDPVPRYELTGVDTRLGLVAAGGGWALESRAYAAPYGARLRFVPVAGETLVGHVVAAWPAVRPAPGLPGFLEAARAAAAVEPGSAQTDGRSASSSASAAAAVTGVRQTNPSQT